nr:MAG TPA: hypothetical protein [Bacteriophage sp.]
MRLYSDTPYLSVFPDVKPPSSHSLLSISKIQKIN